MPEERTAPSAGWRAVYAAMGASTNVEGEEPPRRPRVPDSRVRSRSGNGDGSGTGSTPAPAPESAETDGGVVRLDAWTAREVDVDADEDVDVDVDADADADVDADADADGRRPGRWDRSNPLRGEAP